MQYARVLIEINLKQKLPDHIQFMNEHEEMIYVGIHYEWRPEYCDNYKMVGHMTTECRNIRTKQKWVPKVTAPVITEKCSEKSTHDNAEVDQDGFQRALKPIRVRVS